MIDNPLLPDPEDFEEMEELSEAELSEMADVAVLTEFLNHNLDEARTAIVAERLRTDPKFFEFAKPLLLAWSIPGRWKAETIDSRVLEKNWDRFTRRAGFVHQKRKAWILKLGGLFMFALVAAATWMTIGDRIGDTWENATHYTIVADSGREMTFRDGLRVQLTPGSVFRAADNGQRKAKLNGTGTFTVTPDSNVSAEEKPLVVQTRGALVNTARAHFIVRALGDTTYIEVLPSAKPAFIAGLVPLPEIVSVFDPSGSANALELREGELGRAIRGKRAEKLRAAPVAEADPVMKPHGTLREFLGVETVSDSGHEMILRDGTRVLLRKGSTLEALDVQHGTFYATLNGAGRFKVGGGSSSFPPQHNVVITTRGGSVSAFAGNFIARTSGEVTEVEALNGTFRLNNGREVPTFVRLIPRGEMPPPVSAQLLPGEKATIRPHAKAIPKHRTNPDVSRTP